MIDSIPDHPWGIVLHNPVRFSEVVVQRRGLANQTLGIPTKNMPSLDILLDS